MSDQFLISEEIGEILHPEETKNTCNKKKIIIITIISILVVIALVITLFLEIKEIKILNLNMKFLRYKLIQLLYI